MKPSFRLHPENDKDIIKLIKSIPEGKRSEKIKQWIREGAKKCLSTQKIIKWNFPK